MNQYILKYKGNNAEELAADVELVKSTKNLSVIDGSSKLMLVKMDEKTKQSLENKLDKWSFFPQAVIDKPDSKKKLKRKTYK